MLAAEKRLAIDWTSHIRDDLAKKEDFEKAIRNSTLALGRLLDLVIAKEKEALRTRLSDYDTPNWAYKQADNNGYRRCAKELMDLLSFLK